LDHLTATLLMQRGHLFGWVPVMLGLGIGVYFALPVEPQLWQLGAVLSVSALLAVVAGRFGAAFGPLVLGLAIAGAGLSLAAARAHSVAGPVLGFRYYGPIEGRIIDIDRSASDAVRLTLDQVALEWTPPERTPTRVRISLHGAQDWLVPVPGARVMTTGHLSPPGGPVEPGDFDFRRMAWFDQLGAIGYTRNPVLSVAPPAEGAELFVQSLRMRISADVRAAIAGDAGGFAAAVTTGDRSGMSGAANEALRASNLYHLVSISGMHMGMLAGFVFALVQGAVALVPPVALRVQARKIAALVALPFAAGYLALAGGHLPTERAFIMVAVMLGAVLLDRRALTLRSVAIAALILLLRRPESLVDAGFQMSFAAVVALIYAFSLLPYANRELQTWERIAVPVALLLFSSLVAGSATAPYAAAHFGRIAHFGVLANLLAVPVMGFVVMPGAVLLAVLAPLGLEAPALWLIEFGSQWILGVAHWVASFDGAMSAVPRPPGAVVPLVTLAGLWLVIWQGWGKVAAVAPALAGLWLWANVERPALLIADSGGLMGVMTAEGRALSKERGDGFAASAWLENDGSLVSQRMAAARPAFETGLRMAEARVGQTRVLQVSGKTALAAIDGCNGADILVVNVALDGARPCDAYDPARLRDTGALALYDAPEGPRLVTVAERAGARLWHPRAWPSRQGQ